MFKIYISSSSLENICLEEESKSSDERLDWYFVMSKQGVIYLDEDILFSEDDEDNPLFIFSQAYGVDFAKADFNFNDINSLKDKMSEKPQCAFLLDTDASAANKIQRGIGVICQSTADLSSCPVATQELSFNLLPGKKNHSWEQLFKSQSQANVPSNSLILIDRYIFSKDGKMSKLPDGINNIKQILSSTIPGALDCSYQVLILFDEGSVDSDYSIDQIKDELYSFVKEDLDRPFQIDVELLAINARCSNFVESRNRHIILNYSMVFPEHHIKAFKEDGCSPISTQKLSIENLYSKGIYDYSDPADEMCDSLLKQVKQLASDPNSKYYNVSPDSRGTCVMNRLVRY